MSGIKPDLEAGQRQRLLDEYGNMLSCVRCGLCLTSCPTYVLSLHEAEAPRGRVALARALAEGQLAVTPDLVQHEQSCLICDACSAVCPAGVHMDPLQVALRSALDPNLRRPLWQRVLRQLAFRRLFADMATFRRLLRLLWLYQHTGLRWLVRRSGLLKLLRLEQAEAFLPSLPRTFVVPEGEVYPAEAEGREVPPERVSFFAGCVMSTALSEIDRATIRVLQRSGCEVVNPAGQGCCGALNAHGGDLEGALAMARRNIQTFERDGSGPIVVNSAGCGAMLKDYAHHLRHDGGWAERARAFSGRVKDVTEVLATRKLPMRQPVRAVATYQEPCHLVHAQRISRQPRALLQMVPGLELREMAESSLCCGSAGIYNLTNPGESRQLQQRKLDNALKTGAEVIVTGNPGCLFQLQSGLVERKSNVRVKYLVELLDEASGSG